MVTKKRRLIGLYSVIIFSLLVLSLFSMQSVYAEEVKQKAINIENIGGGKFKITANTNIEFSDDEKVEAVKSLNHIMFNCEI